MIIDTFKTTINGHKYEIGYFPALYNTNLFIKFTSCIGSSFANFFSLFTTEDGIKYEAIGDGFNKIVTSLYINDPKGEDDT